MPNSNPKIKRPNGSVELFMTIPSAAKFLGLKPHALRRAVKDGRIPAYRPFGKRIYVRPNEITDFVETHIVEKRIIG